MGVAEGGGQRKPGGGEAEGGDHQEAGEELFCDEAKESHGNALADQGGTLYLCPALRVANDLADNAFKEGSAGRAQASPKVEGEWVEEESVARTGIVVFAALAFFFRPKGGGDEGEVPRRGKRVGGAEVDENRAPGVKIGEGHVAGAFGARGEGNFGEAWNAEGTENAGKRITHAMVA